MKMRVAAVLVALLAFPVYAAWETAPHPRGGPRNAQEFLDTNFQTGESPVDLDFNAVFGHPATAVRITNDGVGDLLIQFSSDGIVFGGTFTVKQSEVFSLLAFVHTVKITHVSGSSAYRVLGT